MARLLLSSMLVVLACSITACAHDDRQDRHQRPVYSYENVEMGPDGYTYRESGRPDDYDSRR